MFSHPHLRSDNPPSNITFPSATLPERDEPGDEIEGDPGGERLPLGDVNRLGDVIVDPGGVLSSSMGEKKRCGE